MSLADFQPSTYNAFARSSTFPKCSVFRAQKRVRQISDHLLARSNTLASLHTGSNMKEMARDNAIEAEKPSEAQSSKADEPKKTYRRCPRCKKHTIETKNTGGLDAQIEDRYNQLIPSPSPPLKVHPEFRHYMPPDVPVYGKFSLFTAGSIEMGAAVQWQQRLVEHMQDLPITVTNPRRGQWDPAVDAKAKDPKFRGQVIWELDALTAATVICYFFDVDTISPITLMELGLWAHSGKIIVCCNEEFWREGNVKLVCERYNIPFVRSFEMLVPAVREMLARKGMQLDEAGNLVGGNQRDQQPEEFKKPEMEEEDMWWLKYQEIEEKKRLEEEEKKKSEGIKDAGEIETKA